jgi:hypothetical protein
VFSSYKLQAERKLRGVSKGCLNFGPVIYRTPGLVGGGLYITCDVSAEGPLSPKGQNIYNFITLRI